VKAYGNIAPIISPAKINGVSTLTPDEVIGY